MVALVIWALLSVIVVAIGKLAQSDKMMLAGGIMAMSTCCFVC